MLSTLLGLLMTLAGLLEKQQTIVYAQEIEPKVVLIEVESEEMKNERLVRAEFEQDAPIMIEIARCESGFKNIKGKLSDDFGPLQINYVHLERLEELGLDREKVEDSIAYARMLYNESGTTPWNNSKGCWGKHL